MKYFAWNKEKNEKLRAERGISFEIIVSQIENHKILAVEDHPNIERYPGQRMIIVEYREYAFMVPFVETNKEVFLKTIIPSRKATKKYLQK